MAKREFLMQAHKFNEKKHALNGWFVSEKLDGMRCFWDGGISRGYGIYEVPYANTDKVERLKDIPVCTGLWSRYGNPINAPDWWLDNLPKGVLLDGELYAGRKSFQTLVSITKRLVNQRSEEWSKVLYFVFDTPSINLVFAPGDINLTNFKKSFGTDVERWVQQRLGNYEKQRSFEQNQHYLKRLLDNTVVQLHQQIQLPFGTKKALDYAERYFFDVIEAGGEGVMFRKHTSHWIPERSYDLLKMKDCNDAEATVVGYTSGKAKLLGMMGALVVNFNGHEFELSGFTDAERSFRDSDATSWAYLNPGVRCPEWVSNPSFPIGSQVTFKYRELSDDGVPKEARYHRAFTG